MNISLLSHEWLVMGLGLLVLLVDLWLPAQAKRKLGYVAALGLAAIFLYSLYAYRLGGETQFAFGRMYVLDGLALFFKRFFILAALLVILMTVEYAQELPAGISEFYSVTLFSLTGMLFASSVNDFALLFVSLELITVSFYVLNSFQRSRVTSLEAGVKYLVIGALSTAFTVFGISLVFGMSGKLNFQDVASVAGELGGNKIFVLGLLLVMVGLGFKIGAFPFQIWVPDVYQGAPTPATAFLAIGSKAAGFALLLRVLFTAVPDVTSHWPKLLLAISGITILYGNLCAIPQRNIKRLLGYSSIAQAGYLLLGVSALSTSGQSAVLYYLAGYLFTLMAAFTVICLVVRQLDDEDISAFAGLNERAPLLAAALAFSMVSLAGIPPLAGFFGKFLLIKAAIEQGPANHSYYLVVGVAILGVIISIWYYFGVIRAMYWSKDAADLRPIPFSTPTRLALYGCMAGMLVLGIYPGPWVNLAQAAAQFIR